MILTEGIMICMLKASDVNKPDSMHATTISNCAYQAQPDQSAKLHADVAVDGSAAAGQRVLQPSEARGLPDPPAAPN